MVTASTQRPELDSEWRALFSGYFALQALVGSLLWVGFFGSEKFRELFELVPEVGAVTEGFGAGDLGLIVPASVMASAGLWFKRQWALPVVFVTIGSLLYPTFFLVYWVTETGEDVLTLAMMGPPCLMSSFVGVWLYRESTRQPT